MIKDTSYNLKVYLQRIDEKLAQLSTENKDNSGGNVDLKDERAVTKQCLRICEDARSYIESLTNRESILLQDFSQNAADEDAAQERFEVQRLAREALDENQKSLAEIVNHIQKRLKLLVMNGDPGDNHERSRLQEDFKISKQCLDVCQVASDVSRQKIFRVGEVVADGESDQVVVTTLADLFDVKKALSTGNSAQLVGSMAPKELQLLVEKRYSSRFGAFKGGSESTETSTANPQLVHETEKGAQTVLRKGGFEEQSSGPSTKPNTPSSNEARKRVMGCTKD
jgi:hypothetical protein